MTRMTPPVAPANGTPFSNSVLGITSPKRSRRFSHQEKTARRAASGNELLTSGCWNTLLPDSDGFETLWQMHPDGFHEIQIQGLLVKTPRWQQAYGKDYRYTGRVNKALPIPLILNLFLRWSKENVSDALNGILLNWYDASLGHYIGPHRDSIKNMVSGSLIVTISFGEERIFRLRPWRHKRGDTVADFAALGESPVELGIIQNAAK
jgi:alkylated DNA repair dioxygenase AlkB